MMKTKSLDGKDASSKPSAMPVKNGKPKVGRTGGMNKKKTMMSKKVGGGRGR